MLAARTEIDSTAATIAQVYGSAAVTPYNIDFVYRISPIDATAPKTTPPAAIFTAPPRIIRITSPRVAPNGILIPISGVRREVEYAVAPYRPTIERIKASRASALRHHAVIFSCASTSFSYIVSVCTRPITTVLLSEPAIDRIAGNIASGAAALRTTRDMSSRLSWVTGR